MFEAKIIADSVSEIGSRILREPARRLTTFQLKYPRFIHAEVMTHRVFSRNASSSRAIPVAKMIKQVRENPAMPIHWGKNQPGMQAREEHDALIYLPYESENDDDPVSAIEAWRFAANKAADIAEAMMDAGYHKQVVNRILEPFQWIHVVLTATQFDNFFEQRLHEDAQPEIYELARLMLEAMHNSQPELLTFGEWHLPYVSEQEREMYPLNILKKISTARCARVSYMNHDGTEPNVEKDIALHDALVASRPIHASPTEHQAMVIKGWSKNFKGWEQYRCEVEQFLM